MAVLTYANKKYRTLFQPYRFAAYRIFRSKAIQIDSVSYVLVGQITEEAGGIITNYLVFDEAKGLADQQIAKQVYKIVVYAQMVEGLKNLSKIFHMQHKMRQAGVSELDGFEFVSEEIARSWQSVMATYQAIDKKKVWYREDWLVLLQDMTSFWELYEERAELLLLFPKKELEKKMNKPVLIDEPPWFVREARVIAPLFQIKTLEVEVEPMKWEKWVQFSAKCALATEREVIISTKADQQSVKIMRGFFYILLVGILTPFFVYRMYVDGLEHLFFLVLFFTIYMALYYTNRYRLRKSVHVRLQDVWQAEDKQVTKPIFSAKATSVNMGVSVFYVSLATIFMFGGAIYKNGFDGLALFTLILMIFTIIFNIWFLYSPFVEKDVTFYSDKLRAGHRVFPRTDMWQISINKDDITYTLYLTYTKEPYELYIEKEYREQMKLFMEKWCKDNEIPFTLFRKEDRNI